MGIRILDNVVHRAGGAGIGMEGGAFNALGLPVGGALIQNNRTDQNGESGIRVADGGHTVRGNESYNNAGFGVDAGENPEIPGGAFPGTNIDGGGNRASGDAKSSSAPAWSAQPVLRGPLTPPDTTPPVTSRSTCIRARCRVAT